MHFIPERRTQIMAKRKLTVPVDETIYDSFVAKCNDNGFKVSEVITARIIEADSLIALAIAKKDKEFREAKEAQILRLTEELGYSEADIKKLLKNSKPAEPKLAKEEKGKESMQQLHTSDASEPAGSPQSKYCGDVLDSRRVHKGTYDDEDVVWEVDRYGSGYFCHTSDGKSHKKDVNGNIIF